MFTIAQIEELHSHVKSGSDFPAFIQDIKNLGVTRFETYVSDGHTIYYGADNYKIESDALYNKLDISDLSDIHQLKYILEIHQNGETDYFVFCNQAATKAGVEKWVMDMQEMLCTYYDKSGLIMITETIPQP